MDVIADKLQNVGTPVRGRAHEADQHIVILVDLDHAEQEAGVDKADERMLRVPLFEAEILDRGQARQECDGLFVHPRPAVKEGSAAVEQGERDSGNAVQTFESLLDFHFSSPRHKFIILLT